MQRSIKTITQHIQQISQQLHASQEHAQIIRLEERMRELQDELKAALTRRK